MQCAKCGAENPTGKIICRVCGARIRPVAAGAPGGVAARESDDELRRRLTYDLLRIVWVIAVVIIVGLGLGTFFK